MWRACRRKKLPAYWIARRQPSGRTSRMREPSYGSTWKEGSGSHMKHPSQEILALHAGGDLGWLAGWKTKRHVAACEKCADEVAAFSGLREALPELGEIP